jgi:hypothetical protein
MSVKSKITPSQYELYLEYLRQGCSKSKACRNLGIPRSTMHDYSKRMSNQDDNDKSSLLGKKGFFDGANLDQDIPYSYIVHPTKYIFIIEKELYHVSLNSIDYLSAKNFFDDIASRKYKLFLSSTEYNIIKKLKISGTTSTIIDALSDNGKNVPPKNKNELKMFEYKGFKITEPLYNILTAASKKGDSAKLKKFLDLLIKNPDLYVIEKLYDFLTKSGIEICDNGYILAYKAVTLDFKDIRTGKFDNSPGKYVEENRKELDNNPKNLCSRGLHLGALSYMDKIYSGQNYRIIQCIINPADVVSVPDYKDCEKIRVCKYKVVKIYR